MPEIWGVGGGGGGYAPVPVDPILAGERPYVPPVSSGEPGQIIPQPVPQVPSVQYSSVARVVQAYRDNLISYNAAYGILISQFGFSALDATDALGVEMETILDPDIPAPEKPDVPVSEPDVSAANGGVVAVVREPLFENFEMIGLVAVIAALVMFKRQG